MNLPKIIHPSQLTSQWHFQYLTKLKGALHAWKTRHAFDEQKAFSTDFEIRDWWLVQERGDFIIQVYLDTSRPEGVTADDCMRIHHWFMDTNVFDDFGDDFSIEVSSSGVETPLRDISHFEAVKGNEIFVETWEKRNERLRYIMILEDVDFDGHEGPSVRLREGQKTFDVPISIIRWAFLRFQPEKKGQPKKSKKR